MREIKEKEGFGSYKLYRQQCDYDFERDWETIFSIHECTREYVG
jgi:hypothetical protein